MINLSLQEEFNKYKDELFTGDYPSLSTFFYIVSRIFPENICFREFTPNEISLNYAQSFSYIKKIALKLKKHGIRKGDNVAVCGKNSVAWALAFFGINAASATIVPIDSLYGKDEIENILGRAEVKFAFFDCDKQDCFSCLDSNNVVYLDKTDSPLQEHPVQNILDWLESVNDKEDLILPVNDLDLACILFTSGTTGIPKGVMLSNHNIMADVAMTQERFEVFSSDVAYAVLPLHHAYALMATFLVLLTVGGSIVFGKRLIFKQIAYDLKNGNVTIFLGVPLMYVKMLSGIQDNIRKRSHFTRFILTLMYRFSHFCRFVLRLNIGRFLFRKVLAGLGIEHVRACICGGGPLSDKTLSAFLVYGVNFMQGYGMTETSPIIALNYWKDINCKSVGKILTGITAEIRDKKKDGNGILFVKGENCMKGYYHDKVQTKEILGDDGFINTGDVGHLDSRGFFYITGRKKNIIVTSGGKNVFPEEIEDLFIKSKNIAQIVIVGYKNDEENVDERIRAVVYPTSELLSATDNDFIKAKHIISKEIAFVNRRLRSYKKIEDVKVVLQPLEMTTTKKIKRSCVSKALENSI